jgi:hypothetical protein
VIAGPVLWARQGNTLTTRGSSPFVIRICGHALGELSASPPPAPALTRGPAKAEPEPVASLRRRDRYLMCEREISSSSRSQYFAPVEAIKRTLGGANLTLHDLAAEIERGSGGSGD